MPLAGSCLSILKRSSGSTPSPVNFCANFKFDSIRSGFGVGQQLGGSRGCFRWAQKERKQLPVRNLGWRLILSPCSTSSAEGSCLLLQTQRVWVGNAPGEHQGKAVSATASQRPSQSPSRGFGLANCSSMSCNLKIGIDKGKMFWEPRQAKGTELLSDPYLDNRFFALYQLLRENMVFAGADWDHPEEWSSPF